MNPKWKHGADRRLGRLEVIERQDRAVNRWVRVAELRTHDCVDLLPPLRDAVLLLLQGQYMVLAGYEHRYIVGDDNPALVGQAWAVHQVTEEAYQAWHARELLEGRLKKSAVS